MASIDIWSVIDIKRPELKRLNMKILRLLFLLLTTGLLAGGCDNASDKNTHEKKAIFHYDDDGMMVIRGKRTFIIGSYHKPKTNTPFKTLAEKGFNYIKVNNLDELNIAQQNGLFSWMTTGAVSEDKSAEDEKKITELVNEFKGHPALLFWEIADEPAFTWLSAKARISPERMKRSYDIIKKSDSLHLIYTNHGPVNLVSTLQKYNPATDIIACDIYPVVPHGIKPTYALWDDGMQGDLLNTYISQVGEYADKMKRVSDEKPLFMVLQGFAWEMLKKEEERDPDMILYPTYEQSRFMAYNAIIHGATGILYWGTAYSPQPSEFMDALYKVTRELGDLQEVLASKKIDLNISKKYHEMGHSVDAGVEILAKKADGKTYLLTVNADKNPVKVTLNGLEGFRKAVVLREGREIPVAGGKLTAEYRPFDTHIFLLQ